ncbi:MAG: 2-oxoacid:acceptor oxidoreductase family protein [Mycoplasmataceae bacterium]|jgi:2-oxoglutarate ferredoxin oxidoreductase subunit gamma|nr:2-oxoacid:acceptor oxidoreductase family protein [Mycoplasmataceae bacterium]
MKTINLKAAGFGGQGVMMFGKIVAYGAVEAKMNALWFPSYGPETRGGTANCSVIVSDANIDSPVFSKIDHLVVFNAPSLDKFEKAVKPDGIILYNSDLMNKTNVNVKSFGVPINTIATKVGLPQAANMVMVGAYLELTKIFDDHIIEDIVKHILGERKAKFVPVNMQAINEGRNFIRSIK